LKNNEQNLLSNPGVLHIVRLNAPFWCGRVNCLLPLKAASKRINNNMQEELIDENELNGH